MSGFITALTDSSTGITSSSLWSDVTVVVPFLVAIFGFVFAFKLIRKLIKGASNKKVNL